MTNAKRIQQATNTPSKIVIIGGGYAGISSALRLARNSDAEIHLVNPQERFVERIRLHEAASGRNLRVITIPTLLRGKGIHFHRASATHIDWRARTIGLNNGSQLEYDRLIYALGSQIDRMTPGADKHALALEDLSKANEIAARLDALPAQSEVLVVGGGLTGTELVFEVAERYPHLRWTLVTRFAFEQGFAPAARQYFLNALARRGITLRTSIEVQEVAKDRLVTTVGNMPFALCLWAASFRGLPLGRESGLAVNEKDQLLVDETLRSLTSQAIYVVGDSAALPARYQPHIAMGCKTAMPQGIHCAQNLLAEMRNEAPQPLRFTYGGTCVSLGRHDGLVQMLEPNGKLTLYFCQRIGWGLGKRIDLRFTVAVLRLERHFNFYDLLMPKQQLHVEVPMHSDEQRNVQSQGV